MIRIITDTTFGYWNGRYVEPKTKDSKPFSLDAKRESELVALGIAEYVKAAPEAEIDADGNFVVDGKVIGYEESDGTVTITDPEVIAETLADGEPEESPESPESPEAPEAPESPAAVKIVDDVEITVELLEGMKLETLKEFAEPYGVEYKVGMKKADFAKLVFDAIEVEDDAEDDGEQPPTVDPAESIV